MEFCREFIHSYEYRFSLFLGLLYNIIDTFSVRNNVEIIFGQLNKYADFPPLKYNNIIIL